MARDISIMITARDNFSTAIHTMQGATYSFNKDMDGMQNKLNSLNKTRSTLQVDTEKARRALKEAQNGYLELGTAAKKSEMEAANVDYEQARRNLSLVAKEAKETEKAMISYCNTSSKAENKAGISGGITGAIGDLKDGMVFSQLGKMLGDSVSGAMNVGITSMLGSNAGDAISTISSGIMSGAAIGSMGGLGVGTAIGAGVGLVSGGLQAATNYFSKEDDAFKGVVQEQYGIQQQRIQDDLTAGSTLAAGRERDHISFTTLMGGEEEADKYLGWVRNTANNTPFQYEDLSAMSKTLSTYRYDPEQMKNMINAIGNTGATLGAEPYDMQMMIKGLGRMKQSGKTNLEYMNPMIERGVKVWDYLVEGLSTPDKQLTLEEVQQMSTDNKIDGAEAVEIIVAGMARDNEGAMERHSQTYAGLQSTVEGLEKERQNAMGEGYNRVRTTGLVDQIAYLQGEDGQAMKEIDNLVGEWQAGLKNEKEYRLRAEERKIKELYDLGLITKENAGEKISMARSKADAEYMASDVMQQQIASQEALVHGIQDAMEEGGIYKNFGMRMGEAFTKGLEFVAGRKMQEILEPSNYDFPTISSASAYGSSGGIEPEPSAPAGSKGGIKPEPPSSSYAANSGSSIPKKAFGMGYVPYNDFPALLHEGERIMTASENRAYSGASAPNITINGNFTVREEADVYAIAKEIARQVERARMLM